MRNPERLLRDGKAHLRLRPVILGQVPPGPLRVALAVEGPDEAFGPADQGFELGGGVFASDDPESRMLHDLSPSN